MAKIALVGATGNIGREIIRLWEESPLPNMGIPVLVASTVSEGEEVEMMGQMVPVSGIKGFDFAGFDIALFCTPALVSEHYVQQALEAGVRVVDLSAAFANDPQVPAWVPGVNDTVLADLPRGVVRIANVLTQQLVTVVKLLEQVNTPNNIISTAMCPSNMWGKAAMDELHAQTIALLGGQGEVYPEEFPAQIAFNCLPQVGSLRADGHSSVELEIGQDVPTITDENVEVGVTAVTVPTFVGVSQSVRMTFDTAVDAEQIRAALNMADAVTVLDEPTKNHYATPFGAAETDGIYVSRLRGDVNDPAKLHLWLVSDNLRLMARAALAALVRM